MGSAVKQSPGGCECEEGTCAGTVCVDLAAPCNAAHDDGYTITVRKAGTSTVLGTATTDSNGVACVTLPESPEADWPMLVDVVATKTNCKTLTWDGRSVDCDGTLNLTGDANCSQNSINYTIQGCFSVALPGATITLSRAGWSYTATTGANGQARVYGNGAGGPGTGNAYTATISHPGGFATRVITGLTLAACANSSGTLALLPDADHTCCEIQKYFGTGNWSPYPIPNTLVLTDPQGSTSIAGGCGGTACVIRTMPHVAASGCGLTPYACSDPPPGSTGGAPPAVTTAATSVLYKLNLTTTVPALDQGLYIPFGLNLLYNTPPRCLSGPCSAKFYQAWICQSDCTLGQASYRMFNAVSYTVHSLYPLLVTFDYLSGDFGPNPADPVTCAGTAGGGGWTPTLIVSAP